MKWTRPSKSIIELKDTPEMVKFATDNGWIKVIDKKPAIKKPAKKAE